MHQAPTSPLPKARCADLSFHIQVISKNLKYTVAMFRQMDHVWRRPPEVRLPHTTRTPTRSPPAMRCLVAPGLTLSCRRLRTHMVHRSNPEFARPHLHQAQAVGRPEPSLRHRPHRALFPQRKIPRVRRRRQDRLRLYARPECTGSCSFWWVPASQGTSWAAANTRVQVLTKCRPLRIGGSCAVS